jgi:hypothetical protein
VGVYCGAIGGLDGVRSFRQPNVVARDALAKDPPTASPKLFATTTTPAVDTTTCLLTSAAFTMVRTQRDRLTAMRVLMPNAVRLKGLQPHAGAPHPEARPQHLCWRVW